MIKKDKKQKPGPKPKGKVKIKWSSNFAYAIGLIVSDGNLSKNRRHITFVSKDLDQINNFKKCLGLQNIKVGKKNSGFSNKHYSYRIQFGDVLFYEFLNSIGIKENKSKVIGEVKIPRKFFFDFLRGEFDGDGCVYSYFDKRWKNSFMYYLDFASGSLEFINWLRKGIKILSGCTGHISNSKKRSAYQLRYAKKEALKIFKKMYENKSAISLPRKHLKIIKILGIVGERI